MKEIKNVEKIKKTIQEYVRLLEADGFPVEKVLLYGSYAKGKSKRDSDIDICVVSPKFGKDTIKELQYLLKQTHDVDERIEPYPVSSKEYRETASPLIYEIKKYGKEIKV